MLIPAYWSQVEAGQTVVARDGRPRLIAAISDRYARQSGEFDRLHVLTSLGEYQIIEPRQPVLIIVATHTEAILNVLTAFPGSSIISDRRS